MLDWLKGKGKKSEKSEKYEKYSIEQIETTGQDKEIPVNGDLESNLKAMEETLSYSSDLVVRMIIPENSGYRLAAVYISDLADRNVIQTNIIKPLLNDLSLGKTGAGNAGSAGSRTGIGKPVPIEKRIKNSIITVSDLRETNTLNECLSAVLAGDTILFIDNIKKALIIKTPGWKTRNLEDPAMESSINAPRDGFIETLGENIAIIRRRIKDKNLTVIKMKLGRRARNEIAVLYIKGIANNDIVKAVIRRISQIDTDRAIAVGIIQQFIEDN
ncbi:MAG: spore germination protein, partial [Clostridiaceae bacterium]|nr:spore germination protein [Clostridiaceae bacterium]